MNCSNCENPLPENGELCSNCGAASNHNPQGTATPPPASFASKPKKDKRKAIIISSAIGMIIILAAVWAIFFLPPGLKIMIMGKSNFYAQLEMKNLNSAATAEKKDNEQKAQVEATLTKLNLESSMLTGLQRMIFEKAGFNGLLQFDTGSNIWNADLSMQLGMGKTALKLSCDGKRLGYNLSSMDTKFHYFELPDPSKADDKLGLSVKQRDALLQKYGTMVKSALLQDQYFAYGSDDTYLEVKCQSMTAEIPQQVLYSLLKDIREELKKDDLAIAAFTNLILLQQGKSTETIPENPAEFHPELKQEVLDGIDKFLPFDSSDSSEMAGNIAKMTVYFDTNEHIFARTIDLIGKGNTKELSFSYSHLKKDADIMSEKLRLEIPNNFMFTISEEDGKTGKTGEFSLEMQDESSGSKNTADFRYDIKKSTSKQEFIPVMTLNGNLHLSGSQFQLEFSNTIGTEHQYFTDLKISADLGGGANFNGSGSFEIKYSDPGTVIPYINDSNAIRAKIDSNGLVTSY